MSFAGEFHFRTDRSAVREGPHHVDARHRAGLPMLSNVT